MTSARVIRLAVGLAVAASLSGCAGLPRLSHWVSVKPVETVAEQPNSREDGYYAGASAAISRRDYADALDLLQAARARKPDDVRVLNAFGVVYDKLGRFDLSARYYQQARRLDPASTVVAANLTYSAMLQARSELPATAEATPVSKEQQTRAAALPPAAIRLGFAPQWIATPPPTRSLPGFEIEIADASSGPGRVEPLRKELIRLGWAAPRIVLLGANPAARTTISYPARSLKVARGLANTLPAGVQLVDCADACNRIRLVIGADASKWRLGGRYPAQARGD